MLEAALMGYIFATPVVAPPAPPPLLAFRNFTPAFSSALRTASRVVCTENLIRIECATDSLCSGGGRVPVSVVLGPTLECPLTAGARETAKM